MVNDFTTIKIQKNQQIAHLVLSRPNKLNAINSVMLEELSKAIDILEESNKIKCLIISGEGKTAFSVGADLTELEKLSTKRAKELSTKGQQVFSKLENISKPVLASINGYALGGGLELALACDFRASSVDSVFGFPETKLGLIPGWGATVRLPLIVGEKKSKQLINSAEYINANKALKIGLIDKVFSLPDFEKKIYAIAQRLIDDFASSNNSLKKKICSNCSGEEFKKETEVFAHLFSLPETKKRLADWAN